MARLMKISLDRGVAVYVIDSYTERGIRQADIDSGRVSLNMSARLLDAFSATKALSGNRKVDMSKIYVTGESFGGLVALASSSNIILNGVKELGVNFAGHIPISPECLTRPQDLSYNGKPMMIIVGDKDEITPAKHCVNLVADMKPNSNVELKIIKTCGHSLLQGSRSPFNFDFFAYDECGRWVFDDKGQYTLIDKGGVNDGGGLADFMKVFSTCGKMANFHEAPSDKVRDEVESYIANFLDKFVVAH